MLKSKRSLAAAARCEYVASSRCPIFVRWLIVALLLSFSLGCSFVTDRVLPTLLGDEPQFEQVTSEPPPEDVTSEPVSEPDVFASESFDLVVENRSIYDVCHVYISSSDAEMWGEDWLGDDAPIGVGDSHSFALSAGQQYDVLVRGCDWATLGSAWDVDKERMLTIGGQDKVAVRLVNSVDVEICYVFISDARRDRWGDDRLGVYESIPSSEERIFFVNPSTYDLMVVDCDDQPLSSLLEVDLVEGEFVWTVDEDNGSSGPSEARPFQVQIENQTPYDICYVYVSPSGSDSWGEDWLAAREVIAPGRTQTFDVPGGPHDILLQDCREATVETAWRVEEDVLLQPGRTGSASLLVVNESDLDICYVFISLTSEIISEDNWLRSWEIIPADPQEPRVFYMSPGVYDLEIQDCDKRVLFEEYALEVYDIVTRTVE